MKSNGRAKPRPIPEILTPDEQARLLAQTSGIREQAILRLFLDTGLRASELINLKVRDIDWTTGEFIVRQGKGGVLCACYLSGFLFLGGG